MALSPRNENAGRLPDHEELLLDYTQRVERHLEGRRAVHLHLSQLRSEHRRPHYIRVAANSFSDLVNDYEGQIFQLRNNDLIVIVKNATHGQIDQVVLRLRYLFAEDPLADDDGSSKSFCSWYDLQTDYGRFYTDVRAIYRAYEEGPAGFRYIPLN